MRRTLFSLVLIPFISTGAFAASTSSDVKGVWQSTEKECWTYCEFVVAGGLNHDPNQLRIVFTNWKGQLGEEYPFRYAPAKGKENQWAFDSPEGTGYIYLKGRQFVSGSGKTYNKIGVIE